MPDIAVFPRIELRGGGGGVSGGSSAHLSRGMDVQLHLKAAQWVSQISKGYARAEVSLP